MPQHVVQRCVEALNQSGKPVNGSRILLLGLAYKSDVDDCRESPAFAVMDKLKDMGADLRYYDSYVPEVPPTREHSDWTGFKSVEWNEESIREHDLAVILTAHNGVNYAQLAEWASIVVDTRNTMAGVHRGTAKIWKA
jgi:UDP-N-acetyl-D-glucosamine dehydrogenase